MNRRPSIWWALSLVELAGLSANLQLHHPQLQAKPRRPDADILEERVMRLIEKKSLFSAKRGAVSLIAASLVLTISAALASAFSLSLGQNKDGRPDFTGKWKAESITKEVGEPLIHPAKAKETNEVDHKDPELKIVRSYEEMDRVTELRYTIDGKESTISEGDGTPIRSKAVWSGKRLIITAQLAPGELKETWDLSDDRKTLIITSELLNNRWKMVYQRQ
jgi:hypothetical protein